MQTLRSFIPAPAAPVAVESPFPSPRIVEEVVPDHIGRRLLALTRAADRAERRLAASAQAASALTAQLERILREQAGRIASVGGARGEAPKEDGRIEARESLAALLALAADERRHAEQMMIDLRRERARTNDARNSASAAAIRAVESSGRANRAGARLQCTIDRAERLGACAVTEVVVTLEARAWAEAIPAGAD